MKEGALVVLVVVLHVGGLQSCLSSSTACGASCDDVSDLTLDLQGQRRCQATSVTVIEGETASKKSCYQPQRAQMKFT